MDKYQSQGLSIGLVEEETGISKETLRKWQERYGFPVPARDAFGGRLYSTADVERLQLIKALLNTGLRPNAVVAAPMEELLLLKSSRLPERLVAYPSEIQAVLHHVGANDEDGVESELRRLLVRQGLSEFVVQTLPALNAAVGEAWAQSRISIFQEHLYSEVVRKLTLQTLDIVRPTHAVGSVLLTTPSGEIHDLGLLMAQAVFSLAGYRCHCLGTQMPVDQIVSAAQAFAVDIVGLSMSAAFPRRLARTVVDDVRTSMGIHAELWVGGSGAQHIAAKVPGVRIFGSIVQLRAVLAENAGAA